MSTITLEIDAPLDERGRYRLLQQLNASRTFLNVRSTGAKSVGDTQFLTFSAFDCSVLEQIERDLPTAAQAHRLTLQAATEAVGATMVSFDVS